MAEYTPGAHAYGAPTDYNYVSAFDLHKPEVRPDLIMKYGSELITSILEIAGATKETESLEYIHHESERLMPKIKGTTPGAGAGAQATFTLAAAAIDTVSLNVSPFDTSSTSTERGMPVRQNDILLIKPAAGVVSATNYVRAFVDSVNITAGTFLATPIDVADSIPNIAAADEIIIIGNAHGTGSNQPDGFRTKTVKKTGNTQIIKHNYDIHGSEKEVMTWLEFTDQNGVKGHKWTLKGERDTYYQFKNYIELTLLLQEKLNNVAIANTLGNAGTPIAMTEGLIPFILGGGSIQNYSAVTGFTLADVQAYVKNLDKQKGSKTNMVCAGINLSLQLDDALGDRVKEGGITYGNYTFDTDAQVNLQFSRFKVGEYVFAKKTYSPFNDLQTLGASGYGFANEAMVIPTDMQVDANSRERVPSLQLRYLKNRQMRATAVDLFKTGDNGTDKFETRYLTECGFQGFAANRYGYWKQA
jgi:hypothetical protein